MVTAAVPTDLAQALERIVEQQLHLLKPVDECWQPSDYLPDMTRDDWREQVDELRRRAASLTDETLVVLIGNLVTEEALPSYQTWLNRNRGLRDETGASDTPWARWTRGWTAEENRHGELLNKYLYLSGRVHGRSFELTVHHLLRNGFDLRSEGDPYRSLVYVSFQERATKISHANTGRAAERCGDVFLGRICSMVAADEARHEEAYKRMFAGLVEIDPEGAVCAFAAMMRQKVAMPARLMTDGRGRDLFSRYAVIAQKIRVYTMRDYSSIIDHLVDYWKIASLPVKGEAARAQEYVCKLSALYDSKADRMEEAAATLPSEPFDWLFGRSV